MNDAEIAMTLLNRWERDDPFDGLKSRMDLLRAGGLEFQHGRGLFGERRGGARSIDVECLWFVDGSCVVRVTEPGLHVSGWTAVAPVLVANADQQNHLSRSGFEDGRASGEPAAQR